MYVYQKYIFIKINYKNKTTQNAVFYVVLCMINTL